jgi:DNA-binding YbaB/EbfC family protein
MKNPFDIMKQVQQMQERAQRLQEELAAMEISGEAGGGLVRVTLDGKGTMKGVRIDPTLMRPEETEILEDLIVAASADAKGKVEAQMQSKMAELTGGLPLPPGLKLF